MGVYQAQHPNSLIDQVLTGITYVFLAAPSYVLGLGLLWVFAVVLGWVPAGGMRTVLAPFSVLDVLHHLILPAAAIALGNIALYARYMRVSMLEQTSQLYIRTAHAKGLVPRRIYWHHVVPNALMPVVMNLATNLAQILSGVFIVEVVFNWPGMGILFVDAIYTEDYNVLMA
ncbi:binding-protein-dependent transport system inner membrane component, partial [mine drainage metagenome]